MTFITTTPTTVIPTNGSFILDELYDMRVVQVGGTASYSTHEYYGSAPTYLYIKCVDEAGKIQYAQIGIPTHRKVIIEETAHSCSIDETGQLKTKFFDCQLTLCGAGTEYANETNYLEQVPHFCLMEKVRLTFSWDKDNGVTTYPDVEVIKSYFFPYVKLVDKPEPHVMYFTSVIEE